MALLISLKEYAQKHNVAAATVRQKILRGNLPATKMGRDWFIEDTQEYVDKRVKTGIYKKEKQSKV